MVRRKEHKRVLVLLYGIMFLVFFLAINSIEFRTVGIILAMMTLAGIFVYQRGKLEI